MGPWVWGGDLGWGYGAMGVGGLTNPKRNASDLFEFFGAKLLIKTKNCGSGV